MFGFKGFDHWPQGRGIFPLASCHVHVPSSLYTCNLLVILTFSPPTYKLCTFEETPVHGNVFYIKA
jgi:hypothetical protein